MPAYWHKDRYWPSEWDKSDPYKPEILASAIPPGIYCEDEEGFRALQRGARTRVRPMETALAGAPARLDGVAVYVAKPAQAAILRAMPTKSPEQALADEQSSYEDALAQLANLVARVALSRLRTRRHRLHRPFTPSEGRTGRCGGHRRPRRGGGRELPRDHSDVPAIRIAVGRRGREHDDLGGVPRPCGARRMAHRESSREAGVKAATIQEIARGATQSVEQVLAERPGAGPAERQASLRSVLADWIEHAVKREVVNDRRRVRRMRAK